MPHRLPRRAVRTRLAAAAAASSLLLATGGPVGATTDLQNASAAPATGTTATTFVLSVEYVSDPEARPANSVSVEVVGLGGSPLPMALVAGDEINGTWETSTMLPAGVWELVFRADAAGSDPAPLAGPTVTVVDAATPTPSPTTGSSTPVPSSTPTAAPTSPTATTPIPTPTPRPTARPTPLPPGVTPTPTPTSTVEPALASPFSPPASQASGSPTPRPTSQPSIDPSASARPPSASGPPSSSAAPSPTPSGGGDGGEGWGRAGWLVLGGLTSAAGAAVLARQWATRRGARGRAPES